METRLDRPIHAVLTDLDVIADRELFRGRTQTIRRATEEARQPDPIVEEILGSRRALPAEEKRR